MLTASDSGVGNGNGNGLGEEGGQSPGRGGDGGGGGGCDGAGTFAGVKCGQRGADADAETETAGRETTEWQVELWAPPPSKLLRGLRAGGGRCAALRCVHVGLAQLTSNVEANSSQPHTLYAALDLYYCHLRPSLGSRASLYLLQCFSCAERATTLSPCLVPMSSSQHYCSGSSYERWSQHRHRRSHGSQQHSQPARLHQTIAFTEAQNSLLHELFACLSSRRPSNPFQYLFLRSTRKICMHACLMQGRLVCASTANNPPVS